MMLSVRTYKVRKADKIPVYKTYRYACFDTVLEMEGKTFEEKFNTAMDCLKEEIEQDRQNNDMTQYEPIVMCDVFLS